MIWMRHSDGKDKSIMKIVNKLSMKKYNVYHGDLNNFKFYKTKWNKLNNYSLQGEAGKNVFIFKRWNDLFIFIMKE